MKRIRKKKRKKNKKGSPAKCDKKRTELSAEVVRGGNGAVLSGEEKTLRGGADLWRLKRPGKN